MLLTIDAGNTRTKWAIFNRDGEITHTGACANECLSGIELSPASLGYARVIISNVAGKTHAASLEHLLAKYGLPIAWLKASEQSCNVINQYHEVETLGTDRWAALIAAWHIQQAPCIVVSAGTAVTIDALDVHDTRLRQSAFIGGMILPGIALMKTSLGQHTAQLPQSDSPCEPEIGTDLGIFAKSTVQAINNGILQAITGAIAQMSKALEMKCGQIPYIMLSGGDASIIQNYLHHAISNPNVVVDHLVLKGLYLIDCSNQ